MQMSMSCAPVQRIQMDRRCGVCNQIIGEKEKPRPIEWQIQDLESRGENIYQPCIGCRKEVPNPDSKKYRKAARDFAQYLRDEKAKAEQRLKEYKADMNWPAETKSLVGELWTGECPSCDGLMQANLEDYYECTRCRLQICISVEVAVMRYKGLGQFKKEYGEPMSPPGDLFGIIRRDDRIQPPPAADNSTPAPAKAKLFVYKAPLNGKHYVFRCSEGHGEKLAAAMGEIIFSVTADTPAEASAKGRAEAQKRNLTVEDFYYPN